MTPPEQLAELKKKYTALEAQQDRMMHDLAQQSAQVDQDCKTLLAWRDEAEKVYAKVLAWREETDAAHIRACEQQQTSRELLAEIEKLAKVFMDGIDRHEPTGDEWKQGGQ